MKIKIKKLNDLAKMPYRKHDFDAGFDLYATSVEEDKVSGLVTYGTGLSFEIPEGFVGLIYPRSSISKSGMLLSNSVGVVDAPYRGEVSVKFWNIIEDLRYSVGDRICQLIIMPIPSVEFEEVKELTTTERGEGGFGSTGIK